MKNYRCSNTWIFMEEALEHIFDGRIEKKGTPDAYAVGWHYMASFNPIGNTITGIVDQYDINGTLVARVEVQYLPKKEASSFYWDEFSPQGVVELINEAYINKEKVPGTRNCYRGIVRIYGHRIVIEMFLAGDGTKIADVITAYPVHI